MLSPDVVKGGEAPDVLHEDLLGGDADDHLDELVVRLARPAGVVQGGPVVVVPDVDRGLPLREQVPDHVGVAPPAGEVEQRLPVPVAPVQPLPVPGVREPEARQVVVPDQVEELGGVRVDHGLRGGGGEQALVRLLDVRDDGTVGLEGTPGVVRRPDDDRPGCPLSGHGRYQ